MEALNKKKYEFLLYLLEEGDAMVCLDARLPEVDVPESHKNNSSLNLIFNLNFKRPVEITEEGVLPLWPSTVVLISVSYLLMPCGPYTIPK